MMMGFFFSEYTGSFIAPMASARYVGFVLATFYTCNAVFTSVVGFVLGRKWMSRTFCFTAAAVIQVAFLLALLSTANFKRTYRLDGSDWHLILMDENRRLPKSYSSFLAPSVLQPE